MRRTRLALILAMLACILATSGQTSASGAESPDAAWLPRLAAMRALAGLGPVSERGDLTRACGLHAVYMAENQVISHSEDPAKPFYTPEGAAAAARSNCMIGSSGLSAIDFWFRGPFHALGMLDPALTSAGFGSHTASNGWTAACLDVLSGRNAPPSGQTYPVLWPGDGSVVPFTTYSGAEWPDPLAGTGWTSAGLPLIAQFGSGGGSPRVTASSFSSGGTALAHEVITESTYTNPDPSEQQTGRAVLGSRDAVVLIPRNALLAGATYDVSLTVDGRTCSWSFQVARPGSASVSLVASTSVCAYAQPVGFGARLTSASGSPLAGRRIVFERAIGPAFVALGERTTDSSGRCSLVVRPAARTVVRARLVDTETAVSPVRTVLPSAKLGAPRTPLTARASVAFTVSGVIQPSHKSGSVKLYFYRREGTRWVLRRGVITPLRPGDGYGTYSQRVALARGSWRVQAYHVDAGHRGTRGPFRYLAVR